MALFVIVFSLNMFDKMTETINNVKPIKKLCFFIMLVVFNLIITLIQLSQMGKLKKLEKLKPYAL